MKTPKTDKLSITSKLQTRSVKSKARSPTLLGELLVLKPKNTVKKKKQQQQQQLCE